MGDMADMLLEQGWGECDTPLFEDRFFKKSIQCRQCGKGGLNWKHIGEDWILMDHGKKHKCNHNGYFHNLRQCQCDPRGRRDRICNPVR